MNVYAIFWSYGLYVARAYSFEHAMEVFNDYLNPKHSLVTEEDIHEIICIRTDDEVPAQVVAEYYA